MKVALFDIDGVLNNAERFSVRFTNKYKIPMDTVLPFFTGVFQECLVGKADLKMELQKVIDEWGYTGTVEELIKFWFEGEININKDVLDVINDMKENGYKVIACTNQEKYRTEYLEEHLKLIELFNRVYSSAFMGIKKPDEEFFNFILKDQSINPQDLIYWDDDEENIEAASQLGIKSILYKSIEDIKDNINQLS